MYRSHHTLFIRIVPPVSFSHLSSQHILGVQVTHQDMEAIDPDYYKNLLQITTVPLDDLGLDLTFSADTEMFGTNDGLVIFLIGLGNIDYSPNRWVDLSVFRSPPWPSLALTLHTSRFLFLSVEEASFA